jgi:hypothetical protein
MVCKEIKPAYLLCIKDDDDIVYNNMLYYYNIGIRDYYIMLHCANEETVAQINLFSQKHPIAQVKTFIDNDYIYKKDIHFQNLSQNAYGDGCNWHIATDTDEILILRKDNTIHDFLQKYKNHESLLFDWYNYKKTRCNPDDENIFLSWINRDILPSKWTKAISQWTHKQIWAAGQHFLINSNGYKITNDIAYYAHFPYRNFERWAKRRIDFAKTKYERFKNEKNREEWLKLARYYEIKENDNFLLSLWNSVMCNIENSTTIEKDPIDKNKFKDTNRL